MEGHFLVRPALLPVAFPSRPFFRRAASEWAGSSRRSACRCVSMDGMTSAKLRICRASACSRAAPSMIQIPLPDCLLPRQDPLLPRPIGRRSPSRRLVQDLFTSELFGPGAQPSAGAPPEPSLAPPFELCRGSGGQSLPPLRPGDGAHARTGHAKPAGPPYITRTKASSRHIRETGQSDARADAAFGQSDVVPLNGCDRIAESHRQNMRAVVKRHAQAVVSQGDGNPVEIGRA